jgi:hypothetical protein
MTAPGLLLLLLLLHKVRWATDTSRRRQHQPQPQPARQLLGRLIKTWGPSAASPRAWGVKLGGECPAEDSTSRQ